MTDVMSKAALLAQIQKGWDDFHIYLNTLTPEQLTIPTDAAGWTAKDHVIHLAVWEDSIIPMLEGKRRDEAMGIDKEVWKRHDFDEINGVIQQRHKAMPLPEVKQTFSDFHKRVLEKIETLTDEDLARPYNYFQPKSTQDATIIQWIAGNTFEHYADHTPWIAAIVAKG
jgi:hypothetical protein